MEEQKVISKETISRLVKDVSFIHKNPLTENGIYYKHDDTDMLKGYAMIIGPSDTPYEGGFYLFEFHFPSNYPYSPPKLIYLTNNGLMRFNPNLYTNGKVCISILNTWHGDQWSSCQTITTILLTLCTILTNNPLLNEPGVQASHADIPNYNRMLRYSNLSVAICDMINRSRFPTQFEEFYSTMQEHFLQNYDKYINTIENLMNNDAETNKLFYIGIYNIKISIDYKLLRDKIEKCKQLIILIYK